MTRSVDIVIVGASAAAVDAAIAAAQSGKRVLVVARTRRSGVHGRFRRSLRNAGISTPRISIVTGARIECVAGVHSVEAVLVRQAATGRRFDVNASELLAFEKRPGRARRKS